MAATVGDFAYFHRGEPAPIGPAPEGDSTGNFARFVRPDAFGWFDGSSEGAAGPQELATFFAVPFVYD